MSKDEPLLSTNCPLETAEPSRNYVRITGYKKKYKKKTRKRREKKKNERRRNQYARVRRYKITSTLGLLVRGDPQNEGLRGVQPRALGSKLDYFHAGITSTRLHRRPRLHSWYEANLRGQNGGVHVDYGVQRWPHADIFSYATQYGCTVGSTQIKTVFSDFQGPRRAMMGKNVALICCSLSRITMHALWVSVLVVGKARGVLTGRRTWPCIDRWHSLKARWHRRPHFRLLFGRCGSSLSGTTTGDGGA